MGCNRRGHTRRNIGPIGVEPSKLITFDIFEDEECTKRPNYIDSYTELWIKISEDVLSNTNYGIENQLGVGGADDEYKDPPFINYSIDFVGPNWEYVKGDKIGKGVYELTGDSNIENGVPFHFEFPYIS